MISLKMLIRTSSGEQIDSMRCKCNIGYEEVKRIAGKINFNLDDYLYDFI